MSQKPVTIEIEICTNCKSHAWCTRHDEKKYEGIFEEIRKTIQSKDPTIIVEKRLSTDKRMGAFEITGDGKLLFSKLSSTLFPHTNAVTQKIIKFVADLRNGKDTSVYDIHHESHSSKQDQSSKLYSSFIEPKSPQAKPRKLSPKKDALLSSYVETKDHKQQKLKPSESIKKSAKKEEDNKKEQAHHPQNTVKQEVRKEEKQVVEKVAKRKSVKKQSVSDHKKQSVSDHKKQENHAKGKIVQGSLESKVAEMKTTEKKKEAQTKQQSPKKKPTQQKKTHDAKKTEDTKIQAKKSQQVISQIKPISKKQLKQQTPKQTKEHTPKQTKEQLIEPSKEQLKVQPKEQPKQQPKEQQKEQAKEQAKEQPKVEQIKDVQVDEQQRHYEVQPKIFVPKLPVQKIEHTDPKQISVQDIKIHKQGLHIGQPNAQKKSQVAQAQPKQKEQLESHKYWVINYDGEDFKLTSQPNP